jgi:phosphatidylserine/phosphatidylglycerophosphate/cardiolipin synthase-like enzyme
MRIDILCLFLIVGCQAPEAAIERPGGPLGKADEFGDGGAPGEAEVVFSPRSYEDSHLPRVAAHVASAQRSLDIAMYSYSDARVSQAIEAAAARGVKVRFLFDTAAEDRKLTGAALESSKSGRLEKQGVEVRWVNKIMHHKFVIVDGPRDDAAHAATATLVTGSANWSNGAATRYDENTLFLTGYPELALRFQREFDLLWEHSREIAVNPAVPWELSGYAVSDQAIATADQAGVHALFTSDNFTVTGTTFRVTPRTQVSDAWVAAIKGARRSIHVASGHLRTQSIADALLAKHAEGLDVRVYLDGQEYSASTAPSDLWGPALARAGVTLRYKYYAYRWDHSYADQMHHKYMVIDGETLYTGSYNLSANAENATFENVVVLGGNAHASLVSSFEANFAALFETGRAEGRLAALMQTVADAPLIPLVFAPMALTGTEIASLKRALRDACPAADSEPFRTDPAAHRTCSR